jgi:hypothetical protein
MPWVCLLVIVNPALAACYSSSDPVALVPIERTLQKISFSAN